MPVGRRVEYVALEGIPHVEPGDDLVALIRRALARTELELRNGDILVVAQKIVSKSEGRYVRLMDVQASPAARELAEHVGKDARFLEVVLGESDEVVKYRPNVVITAHRLGFVMANAGIDQSNIEHRDGEERVLLLPKDPDGTAQKLKAGLEAGTGLNLGVIINDSFGRPWRNGVVGVALGAAGVPSLMSQIGVPDMFGRAMRVTEIAVADEIASAASLLMGQAGQGLPVILVRGLELEGARSPAAALVRPKSQDMFR
jgi:coenzyme F420-0:L-glutamate ligase / coenzyme F420-1:gamma-L-glutamate ligase